MFGITTVIIVPGYFNMLRDLWLASFASGSTVLFISSVVLAGKAGIQLIMSSSSRYLPPSYLLW
jgi:hypothetical protein